jgi:hypothetical protein
LLCLALPLLPAELHTFPALLSEPKVIAGPTAEAVASGVRNEVLAALLANLHWAYLNF